VPREGYGVALPVSKQSVLSISSKQWRGMRQAWDCNQEQAQEEQAEPLEDEPLEEG